MSDILNEFKYRVLYSCLSIIVLGGLIYLNLGLYVEFLWSYYSDYYQFVDFNWLVGVEELNKAPDGLQTLSAVKNELGSHILESGRNLVLPKVAVAGPAAIKENCSNLPDAIFDFNQSMSKILSLKQDILGCYGTTTTKYFDTNMQPKTFFEYKDLTKNCVRSAANIMDCEINREVTVEISEFKQFFISITTCFTSQLPWAFDLSFTHKSQDSAYFIATQLRNIFLIFIIYPGIIVLAYHSFCFISPAILNQSRLKILGLLQIIFLIFLIQGNLLPYMVTILSELAHESVDSEIFSSTSFDFINAWIYSFYFLVAIMCAGIFLFIYA